MPNICHCYWQGATPKLYCNLLNYWGFTWRMIWNPRWTMMNPFCFQCFFFFVVVVVVVVVVKFTLYNAKVEKIKPNSFPDALPTSCLEWRPPSTFTKSTSWGSRSWTYSELKQQSFLGCWKNIVFLVKVSVCKIRRPFLEQHWRFEALKIEAQSPDGSLITSKHELSYPNSCMVWCSPDHNKNQTNMLDKQNAAFFWYGTYPIISVYRIHVFFLKLPRRIRNAGFFSPRSRGGNSVR